MTALSRPRTRGQPVRRQSDPRTSRCVTPLEVTERRRHRRPGRQRHRPGPAGHHHRGSPPTRRRSPWTRCPAATSTRQELLGLAASIAADPAALAAARRVQRRQAALRQPAPGHPRRRLAAVLDAAERHRLARPRHLLRCGGRHPGHADRAQPGDRHAEHRDRDPRRDRRTASGPITSTGSPAATRAASRCTPTPRRCGGWVSTRSAPAASCAGKSVSYADELRPLDDMA